MRPKAISSKPTVPNFADPDGTLPAGPGTGRPASSNSPNANTPSFSSPRTINTPDDVFQKGYQHQLYDYRGYPLQALYAAVKDGNDFVYAFSNDEPYTLQLSTSYSFKNMYIEGQRGNDLGHFTINPNEKTMVRIVPEQSGPGTIRWSYEARLEARRLERAEILDGGVKLAGRNLKSGPLEIHMAEDEDNYYFLADHTLSSEMRNLSDENNIECSLRMEESSDDPFSSVRRDLLSPITHKLKFDVELGQHQIKTIAKDGNNSQLDLAGFSIRV